MFYNFKIVYSTGHGFDYEIHSFNTMAQSVHMVERRAMEYVKDIGGDYLGILLIKD